MLEDRYDPEDVFARVPEVAEQTDPVLKSLDQLLEDDQPYRQVRADLGKRYRLTLVHGRHSTLVEVILRLLLCKHLYGWSYEETRERVADSLVLRWFCRVYFQTVPDKSTLIRWTHTLRLETLHALNDRVVELARQARITKGRKLRLDATCVQTTITIRPTAACSSTVCGCGCRLVKRAKPLGPNNSALSGRRAAAACAARGERLRRCIDFCEARARPTGTVPEADRDRRAAGEANRAGREDTPPAERARCQAAARAGRAVVPLVKRVIAQTRSRVLEGKKVASADKVPSLFEPHTRAIPRHKGGPEVEFGRHVILDEVEGGIVTRYQILEQPNEHGQAVEAVRHHQQVFGRAPRLVAGARGVHSADTEEVLTEARLKLVAIPAVGKLSEERQALQCIRRWRRGYRWRTGIEGRIASLRRILAGAGAPTMGQTAWNSGSA